MVSQGQPSMYSKYPWFAGLNDVGSRRLGCERREQFILTRDELGAEWGDKLEQSVWAAADLALLNALNFGGAHIGT
jgi:hypothetical protein